MRGTATESDGLVVQLVEDIDTECPGCQVNTYQYRFEFGFDGNGPWAVLGCAADGCQAHQAVRPVWSEDHPGDDDAALISVLLEWAAGAGWDRAWCPEHGN